MVLEVLRSRIVDKEIVLYKFLKGFNDEKSKEQYEKLKIVHLSYFYVFKSVLFLRIFGVLIVF